MKLDTWQKTIKPIEDLIIQASSIDCDDGWRSWPIGMSWQYVLNYMKGDLLQLGNHDMLVLSAIVSTTDESRRPTGINRKLIIDNLNKNNIVNNSLSHESYYTLLPSFKFIISPEGNGIDCHRHYEALLAGCIPIMERNPLTEEKYKGCPVLWTTDYSEITPDYLEEKYNQMITIDYDFTCLFLSFYDNETQKLIKESGNFWLNRIPSINRSWYT
jgi:hypothetical protein